MAISAHIMPFKHNTATLVLEFSPKCGVPSGQLITLKLNEGSKHAQIRDSFSLSSF